jgi:hypothetical protein
MNAANARPLARRKAEPAMRPSGRHYAEAEERWQAYLRRKARRRDGRRSGRDLLELAKAKRTRRISTPI